MLRRKREKDSRIGAIIDAGIRTSPDPTLVEPRGREFNSAASKWYNQRLTNSGDGKAQCIGEHPKGARNMKLLLLLVISILLVANVAQADFIGIYTDASGTTCTLASGFSTTATVIHKQTPGTIGSLFGISTASAPGSTLFAFNSSYTSVCVNPPCPFLYGACVQGSIVVGTIVAALGNTGFLEVVGVGGNATPIVVDCNQEAHSALGGRGYINSFPPECTPGDIAVENSTWGSVKALYR